MSIKKLKGQTSKEITDLTVKGKEVIITIGKESIPVSYDAYLSNYYYPGKKLTVEEISKLKAEKKTIKATAYLSYLLSIGRYTEKQLKDRLKKKYQLSPYEIEKLIYPYKEAQVIDDLTYSQDYAESQIRTGHGKTAILANLRKRGIGPTILSSEDFLSVFESTSFNLEELIKRADKAKRNQTIEKRKQSIFSFLIRRGYSSSESLKAIDAFYQGRSDEEKEQEENNRSSLLKQEAEKCYNSYAKRYPDKMKQKQRFFARLLEKGFSSSEIQGWLESSGNTFND